MRRAHPSFYAPAFATCWTWRTYVMPLSNSTSRILMKSCRDNFLPSRRMFGLGKKALPVSSLGPVSPTIYSTPICGSVWLWYELSFVEWHHALIRGMSCSTSLTNTFQSRGRRTLSWGTAALTAHLVEEWSFTTAGSYLPWRYFLMKSKRFLSLLIKPLCHIPSTAPAMFSAIAYIFCPSSDLTP